MNNNITAIIFDFDGVIIDSIDVMKNAYTSACQELLGDEPVPPFSEFRQYLGRSLPNIISLLGLPKELIEPYVRYSNHHINKIMIFPQIKIVLEALYKNNIPMCIATGKDSNRTLHILDYMKIRHYFNHIVCSNQVKKPKPAPDMANYLIKKLDISAKNVLFIGDSPADLICGNSAGTQVAAAVWGNPNIVSWIGKVDYYLNTPLDILSKLKLEKNNESQYYAD